ncbi:DUF4429 domain-containing protein [Streptomyces sp. NPDC095613]|uniref:DUF4429 domain-containing protein n=1 Tax=Streptomyces sp. NPDC095613 TaxID=3155540 RepID=UPI00332C51E5
MAEIIQKDGTWTFDGETVRIVPGNDKGVSLLRRTLGEIAVPLGALAGISFEPGRKSGRLRLRLRDGADPLLAITGGRLDGGSDPYRLTVENSRAGVAEYLVDEVRNALLLDQVPAGPTDRYLLPGPALPITVGAGDGTVGFDGERIRLEWNWKTESAKASGGPRTLALGDVAAVEWLPSAGLENGYLRFLVTRAPASTPPKYDPNAVELWGFKKDPLMALVGAAVVARLPHPYGTGSTPVTGADGTRPVLGTAPGTAGGTTGHATAATDGAAVPGTGTAGTRAAPPGTARPGDETAGTHTLAGTGTGTETGMGASTGAGSATVAGQQAGAPAAFGTTGYETTGAPSAEALAGAKTSLAKPPADSVAAATPAPTGGDDPDALLRRLRELGELHQAGILTAEEFSAAKQAVLRRL